MPNDSGDRPKHTGGWKSPKITEITEHRRELERTQEWIVDEIFPSGVMHLIGGTSGSLKTRWLLQMLYEWEQEIPFLGQYACHSVPWVYISCDRSMRDTTQTLLKLHFREWEFEAYSLEQLKYGTGKNKLVDTTMENILKLFPDHKLFVIEGLQALMPSQVRNQSQNKTELLWALEIRHLLSKNNRTIIATTHNPKTSDKPGVVNDERSKFLGSQGFIGTCSTMVSIEKPPKDVDRRTVTIMGRNFRDIKLDYSVLPGGIMQLEAIGDEAGSRVVETEQDQEMQFMAWLVKNSPVNKSAALTHYESQGYGKRTKFMELITRLVGEKRLSVTQSGVDGKRTAVYTYHPQTIQ